HYVRVHRADHVLRQLELRAFSNSRKFDHGHADGMPGNVPEPPALTFEWLDNLPMNVVSAGTGLQVLTDEGMELLVSIHEPLRFPIDTLRRQHPGELHPMTTLAGYFESIQQTVRVLQ